MKTLYENSVDKFNSDNSPVNVLLPLYNKQFNKLNNVRN